MIKLIEKNPILTIAISVMVMLGFGFHFLDVTIMEARNFISAREMVNDGNWLMTTMNGEPRYQKPPLPTWLAALSSLVFGIKNIVGLRFFGIIMVIILGIGSYLLSLKILDNKIHAFINGLITITSFYVVAIVIEAPWDIFAHAFMLIGIYHLFQLFEKDKSYWNHTIYAGFFIGLSILCKGPISIYALLLPFLIAYGIAFKYKAFKLKAFSCFSVLLIALMVGAWWYLYVRLQDPNTFLAMTEKETGNWSSYNVRPFYYYWSFFIQSGLWTIPALMALIYPYMKTRVKNLQAYKLSFWWTIIGVVLLSIIPEKKSRYLMPVLIPMAMNTGFYINYLIRSVGELKKWEKIPMYFHFILIAFIGIGFALIWPFFDMFQLEVNLKLYAVAAFVLLLIGLGILWQLRKRNIKKAFYLTSLFFIAAFILILPLSKTDNTTNPFEPIAQLRSQADAEGYKVYGFQTVSPEFIWHFGDKIPTIKLNDSTFSYPDERRFGMLSKTLSNKERLTLSQKYTIDSLGVYDLNNVLEASKRHRSRLRNVLYLLTRK